MQAGLAAVAAILARAGVSRTSAATAAALATVAVVPPAFTGHAAGAGNHQIAVSSLTLHVVGAALWVGGLAALLMIRRATVLADVAGRYSRLALGCFAAVMASGTANAAVRLGSPAPLWQSRYGWLILGKLAALLILGVFGAAHRRRTLPQLRAGRHGAFTRLAAGQLVASASTPAGPGSPTPS
ncbi:CopD family protein [Micromonospora sp. HUAS YX12]|uniref:CopD family protein n=1 Tax=Micromonospora sp. HUAS YX12 TaxID=3156396 RepID=A0AAU7QWG8_9ACTN